MKDGHLRRGTNVVLPFTSGFFSGEKQSKFGIVYHVCFNHVYNLSFFYVKHLYLCEFMYLCFFFSEVLHVFSSESNHGA